MSSLRTGFWRFWYLYIKWHRRTMISGQNYSNLSVCLITKSFTSVFGNHGLHGFYLLQGLVLLVSWQVCLCVVMGRLLRQRLPMVLWQDITENTKRFKTVLTPTSYWVHLSSLCKFHKVLMDQVFISWISRAMKRVPIPLPVFLHGLKVCVIGQDLIKMVNLKGVCATTSQNVFYLLI